MDKYMDLALKISNPIVTLIVGLIAIKVVTSILKKFLNKTALDVALHKFLITTSRCIMYMILFLVMLDKFGIDTKSMVTVLGISGGAVALALKDSLSNVAGGLVILITKPFANGDYVDIDGTMGTVENIDMLLTTLVTYDNKTITIPNGVVSSAVIINYTKAELRRVDCIFSVSYSADIAKAKNILKEIANENPMILNDPEIVIGVISNGESSVNIDFKVWTKTDNYWPVKYYLEENVKLAFDRENIEMPFRQIDVHIKDN